MARAQRIMCESCPTGRIDSGAPFCGDCGYPTVWATHDDRVQWEVGQWRRTRGGAGVPGRQLASVSTLASAPQIPVRDHRDARGISVIMTEVSDTDAAERSESISVIDRFIAIVRRVRDMFGRSMLRPDDAHPSHEVIDAFDAPALESLAGEPIEPSLKIAVKTVGEPTIVEAPVIEEPVAVVEAPAAVIEQPVLAEKTEVETPARVPIAEFPVRVEMPHKRPTARKRPQRPTNKDMLKKTLDVLTAVEQRLGHLETEVSELATRSVFVAEAEEIDRLPL